MKQPPRSLRSLPPRGRVSAFGRPGGADMSEVIRDGKYVELTYKVTDRKLGMSSPGSSSRWAMFTDTMKFWPPRSTGARGQVRRRRHRSGDRWQSDLRSQRRVAGFFRSHRKCPEEYRQVGTSILMENDRGQTRSFLVTHMDDETLTVDGNNPLCGREVVFTLEILTVRDATDEETRAGGAIQAGANIDPSLLRPV